MHKLLYDESGSALRKARLSSTPIEQISNGELLKRGLACQLERLPGGVGSALIKARVYAPISIGEFRNVRVIHDHDEQGLIIAGIATRMEDIPVELRGQFEGAAARLDQAQTLEENRQARLAIEHVVQAVLARNKVLDAAVRERLSGKKKG
jgi:hypothetical protein